VVGEALLICFRKRSSASFEKAYQAFPGIPVIPMIEVKAMKKRGGFDCRACHR
jgi:hypothetical protein